MAAPTEPSPAPARRRRGVAAAVRTLAAYALALLPVLAFWWWQGRPVAVVEAPSTRVPCISYAPYRADQSPFDEDLVIPPGQIEADLARLAPLTGCIRTYSVDQGLDAVPRLALQRGMTVMLGAWIGRERAKNERELATVIDLARRYPDTVEAVIVGNEVLLRREQPADELAAMIGRVGEAVPVPVTYADVWEFWEKHPEVAGAVDFVTIHTLPYWEDEPRAIEGAVPHVVAIWREMRERFEGKPVFIGEAGWPSAGRMRGGARPSPVNQARFVRGLMAAAAAEGIGVNVIESFDQPWKRRLEGTVGGHWGLLDADRAPKFPLQGPVSDDHRWLRHFTFAAGLGLLLLAPAMRSGGRLSAAGGPAAALAAAAFATLLTSGLHDGLLGARGAYDWLVLAIRTLGAAAAAALVLDALAGGGGARPLPIADLVAAMRRRRAPAASWRTTAMGALRAVTLFGCAATTLCLLFDARYRDFSSALYAVPALAFLLLALADRVRPAGAGPAPGDLAEERLLAAVSAGGGLAIVLAEGTSNVQALAWLATTLAFAAAIVLARHRRSATAET